MINSISFSLFPLKTKLYKNTTFHCFKWRLCFLMDVISLFRQMEQWKIQNHSLIYLFGHCHQMWSHNARSYSLLREIQHGQLILIHHSRWESWMDTVHYRIPEESSLLSWSIRQSCREKGMSDVHLKHACEFRKSWEWGKGMRWGWVMSLFLKVRECAKSSEGSRM